MQRHSLLLSSLLTLLLATVGPIHPAGATITLGQVDDFQSGDNEWGPDSVLDVVANAGPLGTGDNALYINGGIVRHGHSDITSDPSMTDQWDGNWTAEKVTHIRLDVRNPNAFQLVLKLGLAGPDGPGSFFTGDTYLSTNAITVPADNIWHTILFDVTAAGWTEYSGSDINAALQNVTHLRVIHNLGTGSPPPYRGAASEMHLDNITAIPEPATLALIAVGSSACLFLRRR